MDVVEHKEFDEEVNEVVDEDEAKTVAMELVKELGEGLKLVEVEWEVKKEVAKDVLMFIMC